MSVVTFKNAQGFIDDLWKNGLREELIYEGNLAVQEIRSLGLNPADMNVVVDGNKANYSAMMTMNPTGVLGIYSQGADVQKEVRRALILMWRAILRLSPVGLEKDKRPGHPGMYKNSHVFTINGTTVKVKNELAINKIPIKSGDIVEMFNTTVYARQFETEYKKQGYKQYMSRKKKKTWRVANTNKGKGVYDAVAKLYARRKRHLFTVERTFKRNLGKHSVMNKSGKSVGQIYPMMRIVIL